FPVAVFVSGGSLALRQGRRAIVTSLAVGAAPLAAYLVWRLATFGAWLPNTATAKEQGLPALSDLDKPGDLVGYIGCRAFLRAAAAPVSRCACCSSRSDWPLSRTPCSTPTGWRSSASPPRCGR